MTDKNLNILDIETLLAPHRKGSSSSEEEEKLWKKNLKLAIIHIALLLASILYAAAGSMIFYSVEMPHERSVKTESVEKIKLFRERLVSTMWNNSQLTHVNESEWRLRSSRDIAQLTDMLYMAFKKEFVKFRHVTMQRALSDTMNETIEADIWARHSAFFFAITTMATIGYGNIVPVTLKGRIICVFFALFGTPLAIITIGDFGKFLSESIIRAYKGYKKLRKRIVCFVKCSRNDSVDKGRSDSLISDMTNGDDDEEIFTYEDILAHHIQVPVVVVFGTLILYIALGGVLFKFLEGWPYIDAFYFCFISLTTVGFGDLVPKEHQYMWLMLIYIGVGLAVTTMCIDLVGRQYVWKIHYFGRKFKEADLLQLLRRKRMIERRLAIAQHNAELKKDLTSPSTPSLKPATDAISTLEVVTETFSADGVNLLEAQWPLDNVYAEEKSPAEEPPNYGEPSPISTAASYYERIRLLMMGKRNSILSPSGPSIELQCSLDTSPSVYNRELDSRRMAQIVRSRSPSGPDISIHCSLATSPSVYMREQMYSRMNEKVESPRSFAFEFSPDFEELGKQARRIKRLASCPHIVLNFPTIPSSVHISSGSESASPVHPPIHTPSPLLSPTSPRRLLPPCIQLSLPAPEHFLSLTFPDPEPIVESEVVDKLNAMVEKSGDVPMLQRHDCIEFPTVSIDENSDEDVYPPSLLSPYDLELDFASATSSSNHTPISSPSGDSVWGLEFPFEVDLPLFDLSHIPDAGRSFSMPSSSSMEPEQLFHHNLPVYGVEDKAVKAEHALLSAFSCPLKLLSKETPIMVTENYCFVVDGEVVPLAALTKDVEWWKPTGRPTHYYFTEDFKHFRRVHVMVFRGKVITARQRIPRPHGAAGFDQKEVPLNKVFKVCRYYSYWRNCSNLHRIVTVMSPVDDKVAAEIHFRKRIFVQFLWPNAKETDKLRIAVEFETKMRKMQSVSPAPSTSRHGQRRETYHFGSKDF